MTPLTKLLWFARHEPETFAAARWWVGLKDFLLLPAHRRARDRAVVGVGHGPARHGARATWNAEALALTGISADQLPPILADHGHAAAGAPAPARRSSGCRAGTPVVTGAADGPLGNLGTGALTPGVAGLSLGTSGAIRMVVPEPEVDEHGDALLLRADRHGLGGRRRDQQRRRRRPLGRRAGARPRRSARATRRLLELAATVPPAATGW